VMWSEKPQPWMSYVAANYKLSASSLANVNKNLIGGIEIFLCLQYFVQIKF
jgi:hypothetical protein